MPGVFRTPTPWSWVSSRGMAVPRPEGAAAVRAALVEACRVERRRVRDRGGYARDASRISEGLEAAVDAIESVPLELEMRVYLAALDAACDAARARFQDPNDEEGWELGGIAWARGRIAEHRGALD